MCKSVGALNSKDLPRNILAIPKLEIGQDVKVKLGMNSRKAMDIVKILEGKVIFKNQRYLTIEGKLYKESVNLVDFMTGRAKVLS